MTGPASRHGKVQQSIVPLVATAHARSNPTEMAVKVPVGGVYELLPHVMVPSVRIPQGTRYSSLKEVKVPAGSMFPTGEASPQQAMVLSVFLTPHRAPPVLIEVKVPSSVKTSRPQHATVLSAAIPQAYEHVLFRSCGFDTLTEMKVPAGGVACPHELFPQQARVPSLRTAHAEPPPTLTDVKAPEGGTSCP